MLNQISMSLCCFRVTGSFPSMCTRLQLQPRHQLNLQLQHLHRHHRDKSHLHHHGQLHLQLLIGQLHLHLHLGKQHLQLGKLQHHVNKLQLHLGKLQLRPVKLQHHQPGSSLLSVEEDNGCITPTAGRMVTSQLVMGKDSSRRKTIRSLILYVL